MSVMASFMVPHPPLIVPEVGKGGEKQVLKTIASYERVADEIASLCPDTIVITSPHATMYADYFHILSELYIASLCNTSDGCIKSRAVTAACKYSYSHVLPLSVLS